MGIQQNKTPPKKTEEQIKQDMKRKWDNFASTESSKINQEEGNKQDFDNNQISSQKEEEKPEVVLNKEIKDFFKFDNSKNLNDIKLKKYKHLGKLHFDIAQ